jgi:hypothetical protein
MSSIRHAVIRGPNFTGFGKRPDFTPFHHVVLQIGINGRIFGWDFLLPIICERRKKPVSGIAAIFKLHLTGMVVVKHGKSVKR